MLMSPASLKQHNAELWIMTYLIKKKPVMVELWGGVVKTVPK